METFGITDIGTWIQSQEGQVFRLLTYKKVWTPYEMENKFMDESEYENGGYYKYVYITNAIETPEGTLLELSEVEEAEEGYDNCLWEDCHIKHYKLLKDIELVKYDVDNTEIRED